MPQLKNSKVTIIKKNKKSEASDVINIMSSFSELKEEEKVKILPTMRIKTNLFNKFKAEAKEKKWTNTTLINEILEERYGKCDN